MNLDRTMQAGSTFTRREWLKCGALVGGALVGGGAAGLGAGGCAMPDSQGAPPLRTAAAVGAAPAGAQGYGSAPGGDASDSSSAASAVDTSASAVDLQRSPKRYDMKKSINLWAFPYPKRMSLEECFRLAARAGFEAVEVNFDLEGDISPAAGEPDLARIRAQAETAGIRLSGLCSFLFWPYPLTASSEAMRKRSLELAGLMIEAAHGLGIENLLVVPGAVHIPWLKDSEEVPYRICDERARAAVRELLPKAEKLGVYLNIENIFFNAYLMSPPDMVEFVDSFKSPFMRVHFDTGNIMPLQFPEHWIPILGQRIKNVHLKEFSKKGTDFSLEAFRPLLDGTTNWPAVMDALEQVGYRGYLAFEYFHPYAHYPEALIYQSSDAMDRILGRG